MLKRRWIGAVAGTLFLLAQTVSAQIPNYTVNTLFEGTADVGVKGQVAIAHDGTIYWVDSDHTVIQKRATDGTVSVFAGGGTAHTLIIAHIISPPDTFPATDANLGTATNVAVDPSGNVYISLGSSVWKVTPDGTMSRWQNVVTPGGIPDVEFDGAGNGYIRSGLIAGTTIIKKPVEGDTITVAGGAGRGNDGDGGQATAAMLDGLGGMTVDAAGNIWIHSDQTIRKISTDGTINTVAGKVDEKDNFSHQKIYAGEVAVDTPIDDGGSHLAVDKGGNIFWSPASQTGDNVNLLTFDGKIYTLTGIGDEGFSGDGGDASGAAFANITGLAVDTSGVIYVADWGNNRIRTLTPDGPLAGNTGTTSGGGDDGTTGGGDGTTTGGDDGTTTGGDDGTTTGGDDATTVTLPEGAVGPIGLDLDKAAGDQMVRQTPTNPKAGDQIQIDVFITEGATGQFGFNTTLAWDPAALTYTAYASAGIFAGGVSLTTPTIVTSADSTVELSVVKLGSTASGDAGSSGLATFTVNEGFSGSTTVRLIAGKVGSTEATIGPGAAFVVIGGVTTVVLDPTSPAASNWDGDGSVGFGDFLIFAGGFGKTSSDGDFDSRLDLDGDGTVGFGDFLAFAAVFGQTI